MILSCEANRQILYPRICNQPPEPTDTDSKTMPAHQINGRGPGGENPEARRLLADVQKAVALATDQGRAPGRPSSSGSTQPRAKL